MNARRLDIDVLLLDVGGVLLVDPMRQIFDDLAHESRTARSAITNVYSTQLRRGLWDGTLAEPDFWTQILKTADLAQDVAAWRTRLLNYMTPLPAIDALPGLNRNYRLWLLSNHRAEWLRPKLIEVGVTDHFAGILVSSETGHVKPDTFAFSHAVATVGASPDRVAFVDDKRGNVEAAEAVGIYGTVADDRGDWVGQFAIRP